MSDYGRSTSVTVRAALTLVALTLNHATYAQGGLTDPAVKKSRQGICHERGTISYLQTIYFDSFDSMDACRNSGGRLPNSRPVPVPLDRSIHWWQRLSRDQWDQLAVVAVAAAAVFLVARRVYKRWKERRRSRQLEAIQRRRWEGHRR